MAGALAAAGQHEQAEAAARFITIPYWQARALAPVAGALAAARQHEQAEAAARSITNPYVRARALAAVAGALAAAEQHQQAVTVAGRAEVAARLTNGILSAPVPVHVRAGRAVHMSSVAAKAEVAARSLTDGYSQPRALAQVAGALAAAGQHQQAVTVAGQAEAAARSLTNLVLQAETLAEVAGALAGAGNSPYTYQVAAATCVVGRWTAAARSVVLLDPSAFAALERMLARR